MRLFSTLLLLFLITSSLYSQQSDLCKIMFYNVENLFDTFDDSLTNDEEFLPDGIRSWDNYKYYTKLKNIYKVIVALGEWDAPALVGLCEIENRKVIHDLTQNTPLLKYNYQIIHKESPDPRGIDVCLLYRKDLFLPMHEEFIAVKYNESKKSSTRDILYVKGIIHQTDTLHIFINHWPSRWGGELESEHKRITAAKTLKLKVDSIFQSYSKANIIITGDFNDYPENKSIATILGAKQNFNDIEVEALYNMSSVFKQQANTGSHKYQGIWGTLDQFIVSGNLLNIQNPVFTTSADVHIFNADFLLEADEANFGFKPKRTYNGYKYNGGFSDHLPSYLILRFNK